MALLVLALIVGGAGIGTAILLRRRAVGGARRARATPIGDATEHATVKIRGRVAAAEPLRAPFSQRECVYYRIDVTQWTSFEQTHWLFADRCDFTVDDGTGTASVIADRFEFELVADHVAHERASHLAPEIRSILDERGCQLAEIARVEVLESALAVGDTVELVARGTREPDPAPRSGERAYRDAQPTILVFAAEGLALGSPREPVWIHPPR